MKEGKMVLVCALEKGKVCSQLHERSKFIKNHRKSSAYPIRTTKQFSFKIKRHILRMSFTVKSLGMLD